MEFFSNHFNDVYVALTENIISEKISAEEILEVVEDIQEDEVIILNIMELLKEEFNSCPS